MGVSENEWPGGVKDKFLTPHREQKILSFMKNFEGSPDEWGERVKTIE